MKFFKGNGEHSIFELEQMVTERNRLLENASIEYQKLRRGLEIISSCDTLSSDKVYLLSLLDQIRNKAKEVLKETDR